MAIFEQIEENHRKITIHRQHAHSRGGGNTKPHIDIAHSTPIEQSAHDFFRRLTEKSKILTKIMIEPFDYPVEIT